MSNLKPTVEDVNQSLTDPMIYAAARGAFYMAVEFASSDQGPFAQGELLGKLGKLFGEFQRVRNLQVTELQAEVLRLMELSTERRTITTADLAKIGGKG